MELQANNILELRPAPPVPLNALRAFEVSARHMSLKKAAQELNLTPSAISHRVRLLEDVLGCQLFKRAGSRIELTERGRRLAPALTTAFSQIMEAIRDVWSD